MLHFANKNVGNEEVVGNTAPVANANAEVNDASGIGMAVLSIGEITKEKLMSPSKSSRKISNSNHMEYEGPETKASEGYNMFIPSIEHIPYSDYINVASNNLNSKKIPTKPTPEMLLSRALRTTASKSNDSVFKTYAGDCVSIAHFSSRICIPGFQNKKFISRETLKYAELNKMEPFKIPVNYKSLIAYALIQYIASDLSLARLLAKNTKPITCADYKQGADFTEYEKTGNLAELAEQNKYLTPIRSMAYYCEILENLAKLLREDKFNNVNCTEYMLSLRLDPTVDMTAGTVLG